MTVKMIRTRIPLASVQELVLLLLVLVLLASMAATVQATEWEDGVEQTTRIMAVIVLFSRSTKNNNSERPTTLLFELFSSMLHSS
jgi:hypothetical protein